MVGDIVIGGKKVCFIGNWGGEELTSRFSSVYECTVSAVWDVNLKSTQLNSLFDGRDDTILDNDVYVICLGNADYKYSVPIGGETSTDDTFCGNINRFVSKIKEHHSDATIIFATPVYSKTVYDHIGLQNDCDSFLTDYREAIMKLAVKHAAHLVDLYYLYDAYSINDHYGEDSVLTSAGTELVLKAFQDNLKNTFGCQTLRDVISLLLDENNIMNPRNLETQHCVFYGDSITARAGIKDGEMAYMDQLAARLGFAFSNYGVGGTTFALYNDFAKKLLPDLENLTCISNIKLHEKDNKKADVIFMLYGTNDYHFAIEVGEPGTSDIHTTRGALQKAIDILKKQNPDVKIVIGTPIARTGIAENPGDGLKNAAGYLVGDYTNAIIEVAMANDVYLCRLDKLFTRSQYTFDVKLDDVHPSVNGHKLMADYLIYNTFRTQEGKE